MIKWIWKRIKVRWEHPPVLDITDWDLKDALEQILFNLITKRELLLYWDVDTPGFYVRSIPDNMLTLDTPYGSIQITYLDGVHIVGRRFDDEYFHALQVQSLKDPATDNIVNYHITECYRHIVDPAFTAQKRDFPS